MPVKLADYPEFVTDDGVKIYSETSLENQMAVLSHHLHGNFELTQECRKEVLNAIRDFLHQKKTRLGKSSDYTHYEAWDEEQIMKLAEDPLQYNLFDDFFQVPFPTPTNPRFTFIDLFAGMGGFRIAMQRQGGKCVFSSEWNKFAQQTYLANYGEMPFGDITKAATKKYIPTAFDVLCAGFPCQPFSIAGVTKKSSLGKETGFNDKAQGTLFFEVAEIIASHRPKAFFLENVKNLVSHDKGNTFKVIEGTLKELGYSIYYRVMDGKDYVPQHRERIMIVGFDKSIYGGNEDFSFPETNGQTHHQIEDILIADVEKKYTLTDKLWTYLQNYAQKHRAKGNGFGYGLVEKGGIARTLSARYYKDGSEILIPQGEGKNPRRLSPRECARLMGYPDEYILDCVSDVQAYRQCGNSVVVPLITAVAEQVVNTMLQKPDNHE